VLREHDPTRAIVGLLILALCAGALLTSGLIIFGPAISETNAHIAQTVLALGLTSVTGVAGSNLARRRSLNAPFGYLTIAISLAAFVIAMTKIWSAEGLLGDETTLAYALILALATGHASFLLRSAEENASAVRWVSAATLLPLTVVVVMVFIDLAADRGVLGPDPIGVAVVFYALGVALLPLVRRLAVSLPNDG